MHTPRLRFRYCCCVLLVLTGIFFSFQAGFTRPMPGPTPDLPGESQGKISYRWIAPYVYASELRIGKQTSSTVTWYNETGKLMRTIAGGIPQTGFVYGPDGKTLYGLNESWQLTLPERHEIVGEGYTSASPDSRVLIHQFSTKQEQLSLDIFLDGKLINTLGPFENYLGEEARIGGDGSAALLTWEDNTKKVARALVLGQDGRPRFQVNVDSRVRDPQVALGGTGVLLRANTGEDNGNRFLWYTEKGKKQSLAINPNGEFEGWVPASHKALMSTSLDTFRYLLVDWDTGKVLWDIPCPGAGQKIDVLLTSEYALFAVVEPYKPGAWSGEHWAFENTNTEAIQTFYAVSLQDGTLAGYWHAQYPRRHCGVLDDGFFTVRGKQIYYVTPREFTEITPLDIRARQHGWSEAPGMK